MKLKMLELWNDASVLPPPVLTSSSQSIEDAQNLLQVCKDMQRVLTNQSPLHREAAILSRLIYKYDKKFRLDIGYRNLKKVNTALHKYLQLNFLKDLEQFQLVLPSEDVEDDIYLPSRQMLEYLLTRLQTFSKIILRVYICSKCAAIFYLNRIKRGESHWMSLIPYALLARLWSMSWVLIRHSCKWYKKLIIFQGKLESKGLQFLPVNYKLPHDLGEWLDIDNVDEFGRHNWSKIKSTTVIPILEDVDDPESAFDIFNYVSDMNADNKAEIEPLSEEMEIKQETIQHLEDETCRNNTNKTLVNKKGNEEDLGIHDVKNVVKKTKLPKIFTQMVNQNQDLGQAISRKTFIPNQDLGQAISRNSFNINKPNQNKPQDLSTHGNSVTNFEAPKEYFKSNEQRPHENVNTTSKNSKVTSKADEQFLEPKEAERNKINNNAKAVPTKQNEKSDDNLTIHSIANITNSNKLQKFLESEETYRNENSNNSLTNHLSFMQWQALKMNLMHLCNSTANNRKVERKFQKIWKQKCLAYLE